MLLNNTSVTQLEECLSSKQKVVGSIPARGANTMPEPVDDGRRSSKPAGGGSIPLSGTMKYFTDRKRHLVCIPYSIENLHKMAMSLESGVVGSTKTITTSQFEELLRLKLSA